MSDTAREIAAYAIIGTILLGSVTFYFVTRKERRRRALRRQGIKTYD